MYMIKNAWRNICRNKGKHLLLGLIAMVIGLTSCLALSIRQAAEKQKETGFDSLQISATIEVDRMALMTQGNAENKNPKEMMQAISSLSLEELQSYAKAKSVKDFYYTKSIGLNADGIEAITSTQMEGGKNFGNRMEAQSDFPIIGYSSHDAMSEFVEGTSNIEEGVVFESDATNECIISQELAEYNSLSLQDEITFVNPNNSKDTIKLKITGIYSSTNTMMGNARMMSDPANQIYTSTAAIEAIVNASYKLSEDSAITSSVQGMYIFADMESYEAFVEEARDLGLSEEYTINSQDVNRYEQSLQPLLSLSEYAMIFLVVVLFIGGAILSVLHIYHIRERKYEIGVLAAIGMNKKKIAFQFVCEIFVVTMIAMMIGSGVGACISVPVTNTLLEKTAESTTINQRPGFAGNDKQDIVEKEKPSSMVNQGQQYLVEVSSATDIVVVMYVCGVAVLLTLISSATAIMSMLRYDPLHILSNRE